jgi:hypothetical protein
MIALFNFLPLFCPSCGVPTHLDHPSNNMIAQYKARQTITCSCGLRYQLAERVDLLRAATASGGDMLNYHMQDDANRSPNPN